MPKENFILVSLDDPQTRQLATTISNESCKKILNYLATKDATETELTERLFIPLSTVHYNLQQLQKAGLVVSEQFHYSAKGREVNHYKLANKYVIIAPKSTYGLKEKLKGILPVAFISIFVAGAIHIISYSQYLFSQKAVSLGSEMAAVEPARALAKSMAEAAPLAAGETIKTSLLSNMPISVWFLIGAFFAISLYIILGYIINRIKYK